MSTKDNGGPAFPSMYSDGEPHGMSLRDYFASKVMQGLVAASGDEGNVSYHDEIVAKSAYKLADEMLRAREQ